MKVNKRREVELKRHGALYSRVKGFDLSKCAYCDAPREALDHVPAISLLDGIDVKKYIKSGGKFLLFPSCKQCNNFLSNRELISFYERLNFLSDKYLSKLDTMEVWTEYELSEMGKNMKSYILARQSKVREFIRKVEVIEEKMLDDMYAAM